MKNKYWSNRTAFLRHHEDLFKKSDTLYENLAYQYDVAIKKSREEIEIFYHRFAANNKIFLSDARKLLNNRELKEFKMDVREYIEKGKTLNYSSEWTRTLENASIKYRISRLEALIFQMRQQVETLAALEDSGLKDVMSRTYSQNYYQTIYEIQKDLGVSYPFAKLDSDKINKILSLPWTPDGSNFSKRIWGEQRPQLVRTLETDFTQAIIRGDAPDKIIKKIAHDFDVSRHRAANLIQTESAFFASQSAKDAFLESDVERYQVLATLDGKTSDICQSMDGKIFPMGQYEVGITAPPFHNFCRSTIMPVIDEDFKKSEMRAARTKKSREYTTIPANMTYKQWYAKYV